MAREKTSFSDKFLQSIKPTDKRQEIIDDRGLGIWVQKMGKRIVGKATITFFYRYTSPKTQKREYLSIGRYSKEYSGSGSTTLSEARTKREEFEKLVNDGYDPKTHSSHAIETLTDFAKIFVKEKVAGLALQTRTTYKSALNSKILPALGKKRITQIKRTDIIRLMDKVNSEAGFEMMKQTKKVLSSMYSYALDQYGVPGLESNVVAGIKLKPWKDLNEQKRKTENRAKKVRTDKRWLRQAEIKKFWDYLNKNADSLSDSYIRLWKLILITGCRPIEAVGMKWSDIGSHELEDVRNLESIDKSRLWLRSAEIMKSGEPHLLYLSDLAMEVIDPLRNTPGDYVLWEADELSESQRISRRKYSGQLLKNLHGEYNENEKKDKRKTHPPIGIPKFTQHDLRRTVATQMGHLSIDMIEISRILSHSEREDGAPVTWEFYNLAEYIHEKIDTLVKWETKLKDVISESQ